MEVHGQPLDRTGLLAHVGQLSQVAGARLVTLPDGAVAVAVGGVLAGTEAPS
ncbi:hypothetical protein [Candidatus Poriferisodalis sp.]|uniref:hypothetical protein n=1 Tax=Candidatus Poriferisodalis sp. TaxID=3101277 RepID=UPI003B5206FE